MAAADGEPADRGFAEPDRRGPFEAKMTGDELQPPLVPERFLVFMEALGGVEEVPEAVFAALTFAGLADQLWLPLVVEAEQGC